MRRLQPQSASQPVAAAPSTAYLEAVSEMPVTGYQWTGESREPKYLRLPAIGAEGFVQKVRYTNIREIGVPSNIHLAGWFSDSTPPGQPGLSIIDGHVDGRSQPGIFSRLKDLPAGARFSVELGNGSIQSYEVMSVSEVAAADALNVLFSQDPKVASQLNLITCGGTFDPAKKSYDQRIIVAARLLEAN